MGSKQLGFTDYEQSSAKKAQYYIGQRQIVAEPLAVALSPRDGEGCDVERAARSDGQL